MELQRVFRARRSTFAREQFSPARGACSFVDRFDCSTPLLDALPRDAVSFRAIAHQPLGSQNAQRGTTSPGNSAYQQSALAAGLLICGPISADPLC